MDNEKKLKKKLFIVIVFDIIAVLLMSYMIYTVAYKHDQPTFMGYSIATVKSESMLPILEVDDVIITNKQDRYRINDIVVYKVWKIHVVHRVINKYNVDGVTYYTTKGDNNELRDKKQSTTNNIVGKVIYILPGFGTYIQCISYTTIVVIVAFIIGFIYDGKKRKSINKKE